MYGYMQVSENIEGSVIQRRDAPHLLLDRAGAAPFGKVASMGRHRTWLRRFLFADRPVHLQVITPRRRVMVMTDARTGTGHRVTDHAFAAGRRAGGRYVAVCGLPVLPASLTAPARGHCPRCEQESTPVRNGGAAHED